MLSNGEKESVAGSGGTAGRSSTPTDAGDAGEHSSEGGASPQPNSAGGSGDSSTGGSGDGNAGAGGSGSECELDVDCDDFNPCTDDTCVDHVCDKTANTAPCTGDLSPCTDDHCVEGECAHPDKGVCSGSELVVIRANRSKLYIGLNGTVLEQSAGTASDAEVFEKVEEVNYKLKLRASSSGLFVTLGLDDELIATADQATATLFSAPPCGARRGLRAGNDDDANAWVQAGNVDMGGGLTASIGACAADGGSWEQFELLPIGGLCADTIDCDDGNECTTETCNGGFCVFTELTGACSDDLDACTDDVCDRGSCTHPQNGTCASTTIKIRANSDDKYVLLNATFLEHTGATFAAGEEFEQVMTVGGEFRLRAGSTGQFVEVDATENLTADADYAAATIFSSPDCGPLDALVAESDDDSSNYLKADVTGRLVASEAWCSPFDNGAWERFELVLSP
ncbi:MAG TPA: hypothetical protein VM686_05660 [Polyangiaceae bacterium]|nr:hypothetical protein [Polyangiaceae bacterium]